MILYNNHLTIGDYGQTEQYAHENDGLVIAHKKSRPLRGGFLRDSC
jgi:hypothetical protein